MVGPSSVRYARADGVSLAYQTLGEGPPTIVAIPPMAQDIELMWEHPEHCRMLESFDPPVDRMSLVLQEVQGAADGTRRRLSPR